VAILPLAVLAGSVRNQRAHFVDQAFLLHTSPGRLIPLTVLEGIGCLVGTVIGLTFGGGGLDALVAATAGCTLGNLVAAIATTRVAMRDYRLKPQWSAWGRILVATAAMCAVLAAIPWGRGAVHLAAEVGLGMAIYAGALAVLFPAERRLVITKLRARFG